VTRLKEQQITDDLLNDASWPISLGIIPVSILLLLSDKLASHQDCDKADKVHLAT